MYGGLPRTASASAMPVEAPSLSDRELRLECARLVAVFSNGEGDQVAQTDRLFQFVKEDKTAEAAR